MVFVCKLTVCSVFGRVPYVFARVFQRCYPALRKRFYKAATITEFGGHYEINLDRRKLRTPLGNLFRVPTETLAIAVATEWNSQPEILQLHDMHLTSLCNTAIDNPAGLTKESVVESQLEYLSTDTLCYRQAEPPDFALLQQTKWDPVIEWFQKRFDVSIDVCEDFVNAPISQDTIVTIRRHLMTFNSWSLTGISYATENLKSLILTLAVIHRSLDVRAAVELSRLETIFQTDRWGKIEWSHELENVQTTARVAAATLFVYLNEERTHSVQKFSSSLPR